MKKLFLISLFACIASFSINNYAKPAAESLDKVIAIVNDDVVSQSELNQALTTAKMQMTQEHAALPPARVLHKQVLDQLINKKIQLQVAHQSGIETTDDELNKAIERIAGQNHVAVSALYERINQDGMSTTEYREEIRDQVTLQKLQQQQVASKITISPQEVTNFIHSRTWQNNETKEYHLQDILIPTSDTPSTDELSKAKEHANAVMAKLNRGENFNQVALAESGSNQALQGGDLGWRKLPEIPSAFAEHVVKMQPQTNAGPIQTPNGFHIIRLVEERKLSGKQAATSRKMIESLLLQQKFEEAMQNWISKLRGQAFVVINS